MRALPLASRGLVVTVVLALASTTSARADKPSDTPSVSELQVRLVESRQHLNALSAQSAVASERLNGASYELVQARAAVVKQHLDLAKAKRSLAAQRRIVANLTVEQLESGSAATGLLGMLDSKGPEELLERASAYASTNEAMAARIDALAARQVVYDSAVRVAEAALADQEKAAERQKAAQVAIDRAIAQVEAAISETKHERRALLRQLAKAEGTTLEAATSRQDGIDERLDASGPDLSGTSDPQPSAPAPTTAAPTDPPPASTSKVETAIAFAKAQLGEPYVWGGTGPSEWDCSGLTMRAWEAAGVSLPHYAGSQYALTKKVSVGSIRRGDLLFWSDGGPSSIYHVALYLGSGQMIHAPRPGRNVEIVPLSYWIRPDLASRPG